MVELTSIKHIELIHRSEPTEKVDGLGLGWGLEVILSNFSFSETIILYARLLPQLV